MFTSFHKLDDFMKIKLEEEEELLLLLFSFFF